MVLFALLWTNGISYCFWTVEGELQCFELYDPIDSESEKKEEQKSEEDKYNDTNPEKCNLKSETANYLARLFHIIDLKSIYSRAVPTPPPEYIKLHT